MIKAGFSPMQQIHASQHALLDHTSSQPHMQPCLAQVATLMLPVSCLAANYTQQIKQHTLNHGDCGAQRPCHLLKQKGAPCRASAW